MTGQGFLIPPDATPNLMFGEQQLNLLPDTAYVFSTKTRWENIKDYYQGVYNLHREGKVVVIGEAAMFPVQLSGTKKIRLGINRPMPSENHQLLLNIVHWLDPRLN